MGKMIDKKLINFRVEDDFHEKLKTTAITCGMTINDLITTILRENVDEYAEKGLLVQLKSISKSQREKLFRIIKEEEEAKKAKKVKRAKELDQ